MVSARRYCTSKEVGGGVQGVRPASERSGITHGPLSCLSLQPLYLDTVCALEDLLTSLLRQNMTPQGLQIMVEVCCGGILRGVGGKSF